MGPVWPKSRPWVQVSHLAPPRPIGLFEGPGHGSSVSSSPHFILTPPTRKPRHGAVRAQAPASSHGPICPLGGSGPAGGCLGARALTLPPWPLVTSSEAGQPSAGPRLLPPFSWGCRPLSRPCQLRQLGSPRLPLVGECPAPAPWAGGDRACGHLPGSSRPFGVGRPGRGAASGLLDVDASPSANRTVYTFAAGRRAWWRAPSTPPGPPPRSPTCVGTEVRGHPATQRLLGVPRASERPQTQPTEPAVPGGAAWGPPPRLRGTGREAHAL